MAISRKTAADYAAELEAAILARNTSYDTKVGPIPDLVIQPLSGVLELQNERIRIVQQLLSLSNDGSFTDTDLDDFVFNELLVRLTGARSTVTLIFSRATTPTVDITVRANFPVATLADESTGTSITFMTLVDTTLVAANAPAYFNTDTQRYELKVAAQAVNSSTAGNVASNRIIRPLRPLNGFDSVFNRDVATGGKDPETNSELIDRYFLSLVGTSPGVVNGIKKILRDQYPQTIDSNVVFGNNPMNVRGATDGGAVDAYVIGVTSISTTENIVFSGVDQVIPLTKQPIISLVSAGSFVQGTDFVLVKDTSGNKGSTRAEDGIKWLTTGSAPALGAVVSVTYTYNGLMQQLQDAFATDEKNVPGRDLLFKAATEVGITLSANLKIRPGFSVTAVTAAVSTAILSLINDSKLGADVEASDIQLVVRSFSSVDNFVITNLAKVGATGLTDIAISDNEYARMQTGNLILTVV